MTDQATVYASLKGWLFRWQNSSQRDPHASYDAELELCDDEIASLCIQILQQGEHVLTHDEQVAMSLTADLANALANIIKQGDSDGAGINDWNEGAFLIHQIQHMIMSQAAARMFPYKYRTLGSRFSKVGDRVERGTE